MNNEEEVGLVQESAKQVKYAKPVWINPIYFLLIITIIILSCILMLDVSGFISLQQKISKVLSKDAIEQQKSQVIQDQQTDSTNGSQLQNQADQIQDDNQYASQTESDQTSEVNAPTTDDQENQETIFIEIQAKIAQPVVDQSKYVYFEEPNGFKVLLVQNIKFENQNEIVLVHQNGYIINSQYFKSKFEVQMLKDMTLYKANTENDDLLSTIDQLINVIKEENIRTKSEASTELIYRLIAQDKYKEFKIVGNQLCLIIKTSLDSEKIKQHISQSDFILILNEEVTHKIDLINFGQVIKYNADTQTQSIKLIYKFEDAIDNLSFIDYAIFETYKSNLVEKSFASDLSTEIQEIGDHYLYVMTILQNVENHFDFDQKELAFKFAKLLSTVSEKLEESLYSKEEPSEYFNQLIQQFSMIQKLKFDYYDHEFNDQKVAQRLFMGEIANILDKEFQSNINVAHVRELLQKLRDPENLIITINDQSYHKILVQYKGSGPQDLQFLKDEEVNEQIDQLSYATQKFSTQTKTFITQTEDIKVQFPNINKFIPQTLSIISPSMKKTAKKDTLTWQTLTDQQMPVIFCGIQFDMPYQFAFKQALQQSINQKLTEAYDIGFEVQVKAAKSLIIEIYGWSDTYTQVLSLVSDSLKEDYKKVELPDQQNDIIEFLNSGIYDQVLEHSKTSKITNANMQMLIVGNLEEGQATNFYNLFELPKENKAASQKISVLDLGKKQILQKIQSQSSGLVNYYQIGHHSLKSYAMLTIIEHYLEQQIHQQKLLYIIQQKSIGCIDGFVVAKQTHQNSDEEDTNIDTFIDTSLDTLSRIHKKEFNRLKLDLIKKPNQDLKEKGSRMLEFMSFDFTESQFGIQIKKLKSSDFKSLAFGKISFRLDNSNKELKSAKDLERLNLNMYECK